MLKIDEIVTVVTMHITRAKIFSILAIPSLMNYVVLAIVLTFNRELVN